MPQIHKTPEELASGASAPSCPDASANEAQTAGHEWHLIIDRTGIGDGWTHECSRCGSVTENPELSPDGCKPTAGQNSGKWDHLLDSIKDAHATYREEPTAPYITSTVEVEYVESGTFVGGEEDVFNAGIQQGDTCLVLRKETLDKLFDARSVLKTEIDSLKDPAAVRANILRGNIALPSEYISKTDENGEYQQLRAENAELRRIVAACVDSMQGGKAGVEWSIEFMRLVPAEIGAVFSRLREEINQLRGVNSELIEIGRRIATQDNHCTANPMFCVQEKKRDIGYDANYADEDTIWIDTESGDYEEVPPNTPGAEEFGYKDRWETVMVALTEEGCKEYLRLNGHNHRGETRIYVESFNRCPEMIAIRKALIRLSASQPQEGRPA